MKYQKPTIRKYKSSSSEYLDGLGEHLLKLQSSDRIFLLNKMIEMEHCPPNVYEQKCKDFEWMFPNKELQKVVYKIVKSRRIVNYNTENMTMPIAKGIEGKVNQNGSI